jgi:hypothetical protein
MRFKLLFLLGVLSIMGCAALHPVQEVGGVSAATDLAMLYFQGCKEVDVYAGFALNYDDLTPGFGIILGGCGDYKLFRCLVPSEGPVICTKIKDLKEPVVDPSVLEPDPTPVPMSEPATEPN